MKSLLEEIETRDGDIYVNCSRCFSDTIPADIQNYKLYQVVDVVLDVSSDGKSIRFVSISIDTNVDAWKKKIENDKPEWAQYIIPEPSKSEGVNYYNITAIPRFMIFDKKGLLYQASASRPSDESTKTLIDDLIKK